MKQIGFLGSVDSTDIVLYLARLLSYNGKKVAVVDYTKRHLFVRTANVPDVLFSSGSFYKEILVASIDSTIDENELKNYEYVLHYFGGAVSHPMVQNCMDVVFVSDMKPYNAEQLAGVKCSEGTRKYCIVRDMIDVKYKVMFLVDLMNQGFEKKDVITVPFAEEDYRAHCYLCIDTKQKLKLRELSSDMQELLISLFSIWEQMDDKSLKKMIKNA